jgi:predicted RNA-binding protein with PUA-like domain
MRRYWLMKSEPDVYGWDDLARDGEGVWDGVRNYRARNNLAAMAVGDQAFFYHSNIGKEVVGIVSVSAAAFPDPTDATGKWVSVKVKPVQKLAHPVTLAAIKREPRLANCELVRLSRLSVCEFTRAEWDVVLELAGATP